MKDEPERIKLVNHQGYAWYVAECDVKRWEKRGYFPEQKKPKTVKVKDN